MCRVVRDQSKQNACVAESKAGNPVSSEKPAPAVARERHFPERAQMCDDQIVHFFACHSRSLAASASRKVGTVALTVL